MSWVVAHQGWYFFPILLLLGVDLHRDGIRRLLTGRRWSVAGSSSPC